MSVHLSLGVRLSVTLSHTCRKRMRMRRVVQQRRLLERLRARLVSGQRQRGVTKGFQLRRMEALQRFELAGAEEGQVQATHVSHSHVQL